MLKESLKAPLFTDGFRLSDLLCQSYLTCAVSSSPNAHCFRKQMNYELIFPQEKEKENEFSARFFRIFFMLIFPNKMNFELIFSGKNELSFFSKNK